MAKTPKLPAGVSLYRDQDGKREFYRVRLGVKFLGTGRKPEKKAFPTHADAVKWVKEKQEELHPHLSEAAANGLTASQVAEVRVAISKLGGLASLVDAADAWLKHVRPALDSVSVADGIAKLFEVKAKRAKLERSQRHPVDLKNKLNRLFRGYEKTKLSDIHVGNFETMLEQLDGRGNAPSDTQIVKRARYAKILFRFAIARNWMSINPVLFVELPEVIGEEVVVLSPQQVARLLLKASEEQPSIVAALAIKIFSGIRQTELYRLDWSGIGSKKITVRAAHSKTGRRRSISIHPTLEAWLEPLRKKEGLVFHCEPQRADRIAAWYLAFAPVREAAGFPEWPQNALRHCFGSYHFAQHQNENLTAAEMGNSPAVVRSNYINAVEDQDASRFWLLSRDFLETFNSDSPVWPETAQDFLEVENSYPRWSKTAPRPHVRKYSVEDTICCKEVFAALVDPGDGSQRDVVSAEDWEEGTLSTERARIALLRDLGFVV